MEFIFRDSLKILESQDLEKNNCMIRVKLAPKVRYIDAKFYENIFWNAIHLALQTSEKVTDWKR